MGASEPLEARRLLTTSPVELEIVNATIPSIVFQNQSGEIQASYSPSIDVLTIGRESEQAVSLSVPLEFDLLDIESDRTHTLNHRLLTYSEGFDPESQGGIPLRDLFASTDRNLEIPNLAGFRPTDEPLEFNYRGLFAGQRTASLPDPPNLEAIDRFLATPSAGRNQIAAEVGGLAALDSLSLVAVRIDTDSDIVISTVDPNKPLAEVTGETTTRLRQLDSLSLGFEQLTSSLAAFENVQAADVENSADDTEFMEIDPNTQVQFNILLEPFDENVETTVVLNFGEPGVQSAERIVPAGQHRVSILHTYTTPGLFQATVTATQNGGNAVLSDTFGLSVSRVGEQDTAVGAFVSEAGILAIDQFDVAFTPDDFRGFSEINVGAIHGRVIASRLPDDARLVVEVEAAPTKGEFNQRIVSATMPLNAFTLSENGFFSFDLERLIQESSAERRIRILEGDIVFRIEDATAQLAEDDERPVEAFDELVISATDVVELANRGTATLAAEAPVAFDVDLLMDIDTVAPDVSLARELNILVDNAIESLLRSDSNERFEISIDFGDGSAPKSIRLTPDLVSNRGDFPDGLLGSPPVFLQHDLNVANDLRSSLVDRLFGHRYAENGDFTITVTATMPGGQIAQDKRTIKVRSGRRFEVNSANIASNMEVFGRNDAGEVTVAKSVPRLQLSLRSLQDFELAVPTAEIEILGQKQKLAIDEQSATLEFNQINLLDFVDPKASDKNRMVTAKLTIRDENNLAFEDVSLHEFRVDIPSLVVEAFTSAFEAHVTPGFETAHTYKVDNLPIAIQRNINPREIVIVNDFFFNLTDFNSTKTFLEAALDHRFRNPDSGQTGRPNGFQRILGFDRDFGGQIEVKVFQTEQALRNFEPQSEFLRTLGSLIDVQRMSAADLSKPTISMQRATLKPQAQFSEGQTVNDLFAGVRIFNQEQDLSLNIDFGDRTFGFAEIRFDGSVAPVTHVFNDNPLDTFDSTTNRSETKIRLRLSNATETFSTIEIPIFIRNVVPQVFEARSPITLPLHPLQDEAALTYEVFVGHDADAQVEDDDLTPLSEFPDSVLFLTRDGESDSAPIVRVNGTLVEDEDSVVGFRSSSFTFDADDLREFGRFIPSPQRTELDALIPVEVEDVDGAIQRVDFRISTLIAPINVRLNGSSSIEQQLATQSRRGESAEIPLTSQHVATVGESPGELSFGLRGETKVAAESLVGNEEFEIKVNLGDGRVIQLFRDTTPESDFAFRVRPNPFFDVERVPYTRQGVIRFVDFDDPTQSLLNYSHAGSYLITVSTDIDTVTSQDGYGELTINVLPDIEVEANPDGSVSGSVSFGELPAGIQFEDTLFSFKLNAIGDGTAPDSVLFSGSEIRDGRFEFTRQLEPHFRRPGRALEFEFAFPSLVDANDSVVGESALLLHTVIPQPKETIEPITFDISGEFVQGASVNIQITLPPDTLEDANAATIDSPFVLTFDLGNGERFQLQRDDQTASGTFNIGVDDEVLSNDVVEYDNESGKLALFGAQSNKSLISYDEFGVFILQVASECAFGSTQILIENVLPTVVNPEVVLRPEAVILTADVLMPQGGVVRLDHGQQTAEVQVPAAATPQAVEVRIQDPDRSITQATITTIEDEPGAAETSVIADVTFGEKIIVNVPGEFVRDIGLAGAIELDMQNVVLLAVGKNIETPGATVDFTVDPGDGQPVFEVEVRVDAESGLQPSASIRQAGQLVATQEFDERLTLDIPITFDAFGTTTISITSEDGCVVGSFDVDVLGDLQTEIDNTIAILQNGVATVLGRRVNNAEDAVVRVTNSGDLQQEVAVPRGQQNFIIRNVNAELNDQLEVAIVGRPGVEVTVVAGNTSPCDEHPLFRVLPYTGNIAAEFTDGRLTILGDSSDNGLSIFEDDRGLVVQGIVGTTINGSLEPFIIANVETLDELSIDSLGAGDDLLCITDVTVNGNSAITSTPGEDIVLMARSRIAGNSTISLGDDDDLLAMSNVTIDGTSEIDAAEGDDRIIGADTIDIIRAGEGNDLIDGGGGGDELLGEAGDDVLIASSNGDQIVGGTGEDTVRIQDMFHVQLSDATESNFADPVFIEASTSLSVTVLPSFAAASTRSEITLFTAASINGRFANAPSEGEHLGAGYFAKPLESGGTVRIESNRVILCVFQAEAGDATGDGRFTTADLIAAFEAGKYENGEDADWTQGDWNNDGVFDTTDLIAAFKTGKFQ